MNATDIDFFHGLLRERRESLMEWLSEASLVEHRSATELGSLQRALQRLEGNGEVPCGACEGTVEHDVLLGSPTATLCLECMGENDLRILEDDLRETREVDRSLLPRRIPSTDSFKFGVHYRPSRILSGDFYDFLGRPGSKKVGLLVGDVAGKGIPPVFSGRRFRRRFVRFPGKDSHLPSFGNGEPAARGRIPSGRFATVFYAVLCYETGALVYANGGHNPPIIWRASGEIELLGATGMVVGILPKARYEQASVTLGEGDVLTLYSDGITEAENASGEPFGEMRLAELVGRLRDQPAQEVATEAAAELDRFAPGEPSDDRTLVICQRLG